MKQTTDARFRPEDNLLRNLVERDLQEIRRRNEEQAEQRERAARMRENLLNTVFAGLDENEADLIRKIQKLEADAEQSSKEEIELTRKTLLDKQSNGPATFGILPAAPVNTVLLRPYYATLVGSDNVTYFQGYYPGNIPAAASATGAGSGWVSSDEFYFAATLTWWFQFTTTESRQYSFDIYVPYFGSWSVRSDDGFFTSKFAWADINLFADGYQNGFLGDTNLQDEFNVAGDNISSSGNFQNFYYLLHNSIFSPGTAYLKLTSILSAYARGDGSHGEVNFEQGTGHIGVPFVYMS
jgi:hypothetical protein